MIKGFEDITDNLTDQEKKSMEMIVRGPRVRVGKDKAITNKQICNAMRGFGHNLTGARVRKIIHHIRVVGLVDRLIATSSGYYIASDDAELKVYIDSLRQRRESINEVEEALKSQMHKQLKMF